MSRTSPLRFVLASASPARLTTLRHAGVEPEVMVSGVDELAISAERPVDLVQALAAAKAAAIVARIDGPAVVLGCDSMLELAGRALGRPADADEAIARWHEMRGRSGVLHTGHALVSIPPDGFPSSLLRTGSTEVRFGYPSDAEIEDYVATGEPLRVAGAFTVDGLGGWFVERIAGDHHNVVGLSLPLLRIMLRELGHSLSDLPCHQTPG